MDELHFATEAVKNMVMDELIALLKKVDRIRNANKTLYWADAWCCWVVRSKSVILYNGNSIIEALKILTEEK